MRLYLIPQPWLVSSEGFFIMGDWLFLGIVAGVLVSWAFELIQRYADEQVRRGRVLYGTILTVGLTVAFVALLVITLWSVI